MKNFKQYYTHQLARYGVLLAAVLLLFFNITLGLFSVLQYNTSINRELESVETMSNHLAIEGDINLAITYLEHYSHTHGVQIKIEDMDENILFVTDNPPQNTTSFLITTDATNILATVYIDFDNAIITFDILRSLLLFNSLSFVLLLLAWGAINYVGKKQYHDLMSDINAIGYDVDTFNFAEISLINKRYLSSLKQLAVLKDSQTKEIRNMAHNLKTPLTVLSTTLEAVQAQRIDLTPSTINSLLEETTQLATMITSLVSQAQSGIAQVQKITPVVESALSGLSPLLNAKNIQVITKFRDFEALLVARQLQQVIEHLVLNSLHYSNENTTITVVVDEITREITVHDEGIGMDIETISAIKAGPYRHAAAQQRNAYGNGLGLQIVQEILEANEWKWEIISAVNKGTTIVLHVK